MKCPALAIALVSALVVACPGRGRPPEPGAPGRASTADGGSPAAMDPTSDAGTPERPPPLDEDAQLEAGFRLMAAERLGELRLDQPASEVTALLGPPASRGPVLLEEADGRHYQRWEYPEAGLELSMRAESPSGAQRVRLISAGVRCSLATSRGIHIGSSIAAVRAAYGELEDSETTDDTVFVAGTVYGGVLFDLGDRHVTGITIGAVAE